MTPDLATTPGPDAADRFVNAVRFDAGGLVPAIAQDVASREVLMLAWMNEAALRETFATGRAVYFSRSRAALWRKGESSGQVQRVVDVRLDCDGDAVLLLVEQMGVACHTGRRSCFFQALREGRLSAIEAPAIDPKILYGKAVP